MEQLQHRQAAGDLRVRTSGQFRADVARVGLQKAFARTDVLAAGGCSVSTQASLAIGLGPCDPRFGSSGLSWQGFACNATAATTA